MWTNPGFSRAEKNGLGGKIGNMLTLNLIWIFPFCLFNHVSLSGSVVEIVYIHSYHYQYDIKST